MIPFNFCFCPNALHGLPHVGHLWYAMHIRHIRNWVERQNGRYGWGLDIGCRVLFDVHSKVEYRKPFTDMLDWMGFEYDAVDDMNDWNGSMSIMALQQMFWTRHWLDASVNYWHFADFDPEGRAAKMLYFNVNNVWWHVRGADLFPEKIADKQAQQMYPMRLPVMFYIPLLKTGPALEDKIGGPAVPDCYLMPQHFGKNPRAVEQSLLDAVGVRSIEEDCYPGRLQLQHALIEKTLIVPQTWYHSREEPRARAAGDSDL